MIWPLWPHLAAVAALLLALRFMRRWPWLYAVAVLPGTLAHELAHWLTGWLFGARPVFLSILPRRLPNGDLLLGRVVFTRLRWWNSAPVALAPFVLVPLNAVLLGYSVAWPAVTWQSMGLKLLAVQCLLGAWPSAHDWRHAWKGVVLTVLVMVAGFYVYRHLGYAPR